MQLFVGVALDRYGPKRTVCAFFSLGVVGAILCTAAPNFAVLIAGQILLGIGSAPAFLAVLLFIAQVYPPNRFTHISGYAMSFGGLGMLVTATPLAFVVQTWSWRASFALLAIASVLALVVTWGVVREPPPRVSAKSETLAEAFKQATLLFKAPQTAGILVLGAITYSSLLALRGLWIVPLFVQRHDFSLVQAGNVVLILSIAMLLSPMIFGRIDPGARWRRELIVAGAIVSAALILILGWATPRATSLEVALTLAIGLTLRVHHPAICRRARLLSCRSGRAGAGDFHHGDVFGRRPRTIPHGIGRRLCHRTRAGTALCGACDAGFLAHRCVRGFCRPAARGDEQTKLEDLDGSKNRQHRNHL